MKSSSLCLLLIVSAIASLGQVKLENQDPSPVLVNAKLETSFAPDLDGAMAKLLQRRGDPLWIGYSQPTIPGPRFICCFDSIEQFRRLKGCCSGCKLEGKQGSFFNSTGGTCVNKDVPQRNAFILLRIAAGRIDRVRSFTPDCGLDAGNRTVVWLTGVNSAQSIAYLERLVRSDHSVAEEAVAAIGLHADPLADKALERIVLQQDSDLREPAAFWLGSQRSRTGYEIVRDLARKDPDPKLREELTFVISESGEKDAIPELIQIARTDRAADVRGQALFWLGQKASEEAEKAITETVEKDPDAEVKRKAVFALSQLPKEQGVPLLMKYARSNNPLIRKEAIFWLGESEDPRALDFLEKFLLEKN
jgi:hypothetical protein